MDSGFKLLYVWIGDYKGLKDVELIFDNNYDYKMIHISNIEKILKVTKKNIENIKHFWSTKPQSNINNITLILGKNGVGKTRIINLLKYGMKYSSITNRHNFTPSAISDNIKYIFLYKYTENYYIYSHIFVSKPELGDNLIMEINENNINNIHIKRDNFQQVDSLKGKMQIILYSSSFNYINKHNPLTYYRCFDISNYALMHDKSYLNDYKIINTDNSLYDRFNSFNNYLYLKYINSLKTTLKVSNINNDLFNTLKKIEKINFSLSEIDLINIDISQYKNNISEIYLNLYENNFYIDDGIISVYIYQLITEIYNSENKKFNKLKEKISELKSNMFLNFKQFVDKINELFNNFYENDLENLLIYKMTKTFSNESIMKLLEYISKNSVAEIDIKEAELFVIKNKYLIGNLINISFDKNLSEGEITILNIITRLLYIVELKDINDVLLIIDELDANLHPEWQRKILNELILILNESDEFKNKNIQIIITSHSPIIASDFPAENIIFLDKNEKDETVVKNSNIKTFGANIYNLLKNSFFLDSFIGDFAKEKINNVIELLNSNKEFTDDERREIKIIIDYIGEPVLRNKLLEMYKQKSKADEPNEIYKLKNELAELKRQINELKNK